jgi:hypothetical protein
VQASRQAAQRLEISYSSPRALKGGAESLFAHFQCAHDLIGPIPGAARFALAPGYLLPRLRRLLLVSEEADTTVARTSSSIAIEKVDVISSWLEVKQNAAGEY